MISRVLRAALSTFRRDKLAHGRVPADKPVVLNFYVNAAFATQLRHMIMRSCGDLLTYMRIVPTLHATKIRVWLCISQPATALVLQAALRTIPGVEFPDAVKF
jgi:hypothetical protein